MVEELVRRWNASPGDCRDEYRSWDATVRGHTVTLFEASDSLGGQINLARRVPGKSEFNEMLRAFRTRLWEAGVTVKLGTKATAALLKAAH